MKQDRKSIRQRNAIWKANGEPIIIITFDGFPNGEVSMWQTANHATDFDIVRQALVKMHEHLGKFLENERMCPFHPEFCDNDIERRPHGP